ncbi:MAG: glycosyltransferase family 4 protein [Candidatus Moranbacteria bacterium]|nr:glycosyltransferase family 4 protein [Candidatus Moranbacteria bacterium]
MRIAFIGQKGIPAKTGGVERHVEHLSKQLASQGHEVFVYARSHYTKRSCAKVGGVNIVHVPTIYTKHLDAIVHTLFATVHAVFKKYDIVHYQSIGPSFLSGLMRILAQKTVVIATFHSQDYLHKKWGWFARLSLRLAEWSTCTIPHATIVVSKTLQKYVWQAYQRKAIYIPNGAEKIGTESKEALIKEFGLEKESYILCVSRLVAHKGVHLAINAFKKLKEEGVLQKSMKLAVVGGGAFTDGYVERLKESAKKDDAIVLTGQQDGEMLHELYKNATMFVQPSESEGLSIALLEAMCYALPIVASDIEENKEIVGKNCALLFNSGNDHDLAEKMKEMLGMKGSIREKMKKSSEKNVKENYHWNKIAQKTTKIYDLLSQKKKAKTL